MGTRIDGDGRPKFHAELERSSEGEDKKPAGAIGWDSAAQQAQEADEAEGPAGAGSQDTIADKKARGLPTGDEIVTGAPPPSVRPGDRGQPLPDDVAGVDATKKNNENTRHTLRVLDDLRDLQALLSRTKEDKSSDRLQEIDELQKMRVVMAEKHKGIVDELRAVLPELMALLGTDQGFVGAYVTGDREREIAQMVPDELGNNREAAIVELTLEALADNARGRLEKTFKVELLGTEQPPRRL